MARKTGLGKGLDALIPASAKMNFQPEEESAVAGVDQVAIGAIQPNPRQPRNRFDPQELEELALSIKEHGILQPLLVTKDPDSDQFTLVAGERRLIAARTAGLQTVPAIILEVTEQQRIELALIENLQRSDLGPLEAAEAYRQLADEFQLSHDQISQRVGKSRSAITNTLRLLNLPASIQKSLAEKEISEGHARAILALPTHQAQIAAFQTIVKQGLTVRQTEELVRKLVGQKPVVPIKKTLPPEYAAVEERLRESLGTKVTLNHRTNAGTLVIHYYSVEELDELVNRILNNS